MSEVDRPLGLWAPLGSKASLRPTVLAIPAVLGAIGQATALVIVDPTILLWQSAGAAAGYWLACLGMLTVLSTLPLAWTPGRVGCAMTATAASIGLALGVVLASAVTPGVDWPWVGAVVIGSSTLMVVGATAIRARQDYRESVGDREKALVELRAQLDAIIASREKMASLCDGLMRATTAAADEARLRLAGAQDPADLRDFIEVAVRQPARRVSHEVYRMSPAAPARSRWDGWRHVPVRPHLAAGFVLVGALGVPYALLAAPAGVGLLGQIVGVACGLAIAYAVEAVLGRWQFAAAKALVSLAAGVLVGMSVSGLIWWAQPGLAIAHALAFLPLAGLIAATPAAMSMTAYRRGRSLDELDAHVAADSAHLEMQKEALESDRRHISWLLHTRVQGRATAVQVALAAGLGLDATMGILDDLAGMTQCTPPSLGSVIDDWAPILDVRVSGGEGLTTDDERTVAWTVDEALANSAHHGGASRASVRVSVDARGISVWVTDNGRGRPGQHRGGLSTARIQAGGGSWVVETGADGTRVRVHIPRSL